MIKEVIDSVKEAELGASKLEKAAAEKAKLIVFGAEEEGKDLLKTKIKEIKPKIDLHINFAKSKAQECHKRAEKEANIKIEKIKNNAINKKQDIINGILTRIFA